MAKVYLLFQRIWSNISILLYDISLIFRDKLFVNCYVVRKGSGICNVNWGDDINYYFLESLTGKSVVAKNKSILYKHLPVTNYCCIGSLLGDFIDEKTEIWGSGFISADKRINCHPHKIHSVRGPLTRDALIQQNIQCPEKYGDPALLLSKVYKPHCSTRYKVGIVLHYVDSDNPIIRSYARNNKDSIIIDMRGYARWTDIIDMVCSCELVLSSSLHGLIIADSYEIPNAWIGLSDNIIGKDFKFKDYFASVSRTEEKKQIHSADDIEGIVSAGAEYTASINYDDILSSCPFLKGNHTLSTSLE